MEIKKIKKLNKGFTLVELMVSTSIFSIIMLSSIGALFTLLGVSKNSRMSHTAMDNVNFALESMVRSIRMGTDYGCSCPGENETSCSNEGSKIFSFMPQGKKADDDRVCYYESDKKIYRKTGGEVEAIQLVSDTIDIEELKFFMVKDPSVQPRVFIKIRGLAKVKDEDIPFNIQTLVSQRNYDGATSGQSGLN